MNKHPEVKITSMVSVLADKAERQKKKIAAMLSLPKKQRNKEHLKKILKENRSIRKILKNVIIPRVTCPHCGNEFKPKKV